MEWRAFESAAPGLARRAREALERHHVAILGTISIDGAPRLSPVEPFFLAGRLVLGLMPWSGKAHDLARDPRCELHNSVTDVTGGDGEVRLTGRAVPVDRSQLAGEDDGAWWAGLDEDRYRLVSVEIVSLASVTWDTAGGRMMVDRWTGEGLTQTTRDYP
jgi:hypothetical protein